MDTRQCPYCQATTHQHKYGRHPSGTQRYQCQHCMRRYTPQPKKRVSNGGRPKLDESIRQQVLVLHRQGMKRRAIGRQLGISHETVNKWVNDAQRQDSSS